MSAAATSEHTVLEIVRAHMRAEHGHDLDGTVATFTEDCHYFVAPLRLHLHGRDAIRDWYEHLFAGIPDYTDYDERFWVFDDDPEDRFVLYRATMTGTHLGKWHGWYPTGRRFAVPMLVRIPIAADGLMAGEEIFFDSADLFAQLGILPDRDSLSERAMKRAHAIWSTLFHR
jgi:ketosteroid isomerase-like protein